MKRLNIELLNVIHPKSYISKSKIGVGNYIKSAVYETGTKIGDCCIIDNGVVIAHDNNIEMAATLLLEYQWEVVFI